MTGVQILELFSFGESLKLFLCVCEMGMFLSVCQSGGGDMMYEISYRMTLKI